MADLGTKITCYFAQFAGVPAGAPDVPAGSTQWVIAQNTLTGYFYYYDLLISAWVQLKMASDPLAVLGQVIVPAGAGVATVTFSSIPATYSQLRFSIVARCTGSGSPYALLMRMNGDSGGSNYPQQLINGVGGTVTATGATAGYITIGNIPGAATVTPDGGYVTGVLPGYARTDWYKLLFADQSKTIYPPVNPVTGIWTSTAAITSLTFYVASQNIAPASIFTLWGE